MKCMVLAAVVAPTRSVAASRHSGPSCPRLSWAPPGRPLADLAASLHPGRKLACRYASQGGRGGEGRKEWRGGEGRGGREGGEERGRRGEEGGRGRGRGKKERGGGGRERERGGVGAVASASPRSVSYVPLAATDISDSGDSLHFG